MCEYEALGQIQSPFYTQKLRKTLVAALTRENAHLSPSAAGCSYTEKNLATGISLTAH